ncbi:MAG: hypothetical protein ACLVIY_09470 [Anaerobutyricum soehngenii]
MYVATGFNGWGMTSAMTAAMLANGCDLEWTSSDGATEAVIIHGRSFLSRAKDCAFHSILRM